MGDPGLQPGRGRPRGTLGTERGRRSAPLPATGLVFTGSSASNVAAARTFWSSAALPPHIESRLAPAALHQNEKNSEKERILEAHNMQKIEEKEKYLQQLQNKLQASANIMKMQLKTLPLEKKAKKREEILALLRKQREERIAKELISCAYKPRIKTEQLSREKVSDCDLVDQEAVKALE